MKLASSVVILLLCFTAQAQQFSVIKYGTEDGLGHSIVYRIYQDKKGFLWFSTDNGLTRYDGQQFRNFVAKDGLRSNFIFDVVENDSAIVVSTFGGGLQLTDGLRIDTVSRIAPTIEFPVKILQADSILFVIDRALDLYKVTKHEVKKIENDIDYPIKKVSQIIKSSRGLIVCSYGIYAYNTHNDKLEKLPIKGLSELGYENSYTSDAIPLAGNRLLTCTKDLLIVIDLKDLTLRTIFKGDFSLATRSSLVCSDSSLLVAETNGTLWRLSSDFKHREKIFQDVVINDMFQDNDGNVWLATYGQGLWRIPTFNSRFYELKGLLNPTIFYSNITQSVIVNSLNSAPINFIDKKIIKNDNALPKIFHLTSVDFQRRTIYLYEPNDRSEIIIGSLYGVTRQRGNMIDSILLRKTQSAFFKDSRGYYWAGMRTGLLKIDDTFKKRNWNTLFDDKIIRDLNEDRQGRIVVGTNDGLFRLENNEWKRFGKEHSLSNEYVNSLLYDKAQKQLWIGTNEGLFYMDSTDKIRTANADIRCNSLLLDKRGYLWAVTSQGLLVYDQKRYQILSKEDGIDGELIKITYQQEGDVLYVLSNLGVRTITLREFIAEMQNPIPSIIVTEQVINGQSLPLNATLNRLSISTSSVTLRLAAPCFKNVDNWSVYYRINEGDWINAGKNRELNFLNLPIGNVAIQLQLRDEANQLESKIITHSYFIPIPFTKTSEFLILSAVVFLLLSALLFAVLMRYINKKRQLKIYSQQRQIELEQKVLRNMLNPHFMNNALNAIQTFVTRNDQRKTLGYLAKFARLMRINLELLEQSTVSLDKELQNLELYLEFEVLRSSETLAYKIDCDATVNQTKIKVPSLVLQPFVENAIWHGILPSQQKGTVTITIRESDNLLYIQITDDGIGINEANKRKISTPAMKPSRGVNLIRDRFTLLNQQHASHSFEISDNEKIGSQGTTVRITLPVQH